MKPVKIFWKTSLACLLGFWTSVSANPLILLAGPSNTGGGGGGVDATPPTLTPRFINGNTLVIDFSEPVGVGAGYNDSDFELDMSTTGTNIALTYVSGNGTSVRTYTTASPAVYGETVTLAFNGDLNSLEDAAGNDLVAVLATAVTNTTAAPLPTASQFLAYWSLDDTGDPGTWVDRKGTYDLIKGSATISWASGKVAGGASFNDATNDYLYNAGITFNNTFHTSDFSVGGWINMDDYPDDVIMISQYADTATSGKRHYQIVKSKTTNKFQFAMTNLAGTAFVAESDAAYTANGSWIFLVGTRTSNVLRLYVNGVLQATTATFSGSEQTATQTVRLASNFDNTYFDGKLDEVWVSTSAFSAGQIQSLYNSGTGVAWSTIAP